MTDSSQVHRAYPPVSPYLPPLCNSVRQMLKFRWSLRCWETLQGKNDSRALLEEAATAVHHLGLVPMPPGSPLRLVYDEMVSQGRDTDSMTPHGVIGSNPIPVNADATRAHAGGHGDGLMHAASLGVPPVAAGVLRDLHREGALNGEAVNVWGDGSGATHELQRALGAPAPGADTGAQDLQPADGMGSTNSAAGGVSMPGQWMQPPVPQAGNAGGKRKAGAAFGDTALPEADTEW